MHQGSEALFEAMLREERASSSPRPASYDYLGDGNSSAVSTLPW